MGHFFVEKLVDGALPHAEGHDVLGDDDLVGELPQVRLHVAAKHGFHFVGGTREHKDVDALRFEGAAGGGAHGVVEDRAALRQFRLLGVVLRHGDVEGGFVESPDVLENVGVEDEGLSEGFADGLFGEVVAGGAQAAGGDEDVRTAAGDVQRLPEALGVVAYDGVPEDVDA